MKRGIHPDLMKTKVTCLGCNTTFDTVSTVPAIDIEICSACHPFYTGKQKLVDTAGRVDRFRAQTKAAQDKNASRTAKKPRLKKDQADKDLAAVKADITSHTIDTGTSSEDE